MRFDPEARVVVPPPGSGVDGPLGLSFLRHLDLDLHLRSGVIEAVSS